MKKQSFRLWIVILISLLPAGYLAMVWNTLPELVPVHYGADLKPDRLGNKKELWILTGILAAGSMLTYLLLTNLHRIDPKRKGAGASATFPKLAMGIAVFMAAINLIIIASAKGSMEFQSFLFPLLGLLFAFLGNYMNHIKPNYFAGIRLPWTLSSDENWRRTHQLAGKLWFAGGVLLAIAGFILQPSAMFPVFIALMIVLIFIPVIYSFRLFKQQV